MAGWGERYEKVIPFFAEGVHTSAEPDLIPEDASKWALNAAWQSVGDGTAVIRRRRGMRLLTDVDAESAIVYQHNYRRLDAGVYTQHHLLVTEHGIVLDRSVAGSTTPFGDLTLGSTDIISAVTANNLALFVNGALITLGGQSYSGVKYDGTTWTRIGILRPDTPNVTIVGGGDMVGDYDIALTYYNENTGHESSRSDAITVTLTGSQLIVYWVQPVDPQVTHVRVYIRKQAISVAFYEVAEVAVTDGLTTTINIDDDAYNALITPAPDTNDNDPPPAGLRYLAWHRNRLFAADASTVYYSQLGLPEAFDPEATELVNPDDGQAITGLYAAHDLLIIFKENSFYVLEGQAPQDWVIRQVSKDIGCVGHRSVISADGVTYWWSERGPCAWNGGDEPVLIGTPYIQSYLTGEALNFSYLRLVCAAVDTQQERLMWAVPELGNARPSSIFPWHFRLQKWEGRWDPIQIASFGMAEDGTGRPWVYVGGYNGRLYKWWDYDTDGHPGGRLYGSFTAASTQLSTVTLTSGTSFDTTYGLEGLYLTVVDSDGDFVGRNYITANDATTLTLGVPITGLTVGGSYTFYLANVNFMLDTKWYDDGRPFWKKRYEYFYLQAKTPGTATVYVDFAYNFDELSPVTKLAVITGGPAAIWDQSLWDVAVWSSAIPANKRIRVGHTGRTWRVRLRLHVPNQPLVVTKVGMRGEFLTDKR